MGTVVLKTTFQFRRAKASEWKPDTVLRIGEPGFEIDTGRLKIGDGQTPWPRLSYLNAAASLSEDGNSLAISKNGKLEIFGFEGAQTNQYPRKNATGQIEWVNLSLRRDNDYNYDKIKDSFVPAYGEICLVDTAADGLQIICGDGKSTYGELSYVDGTLIRGYYHEGNFYKESEHLNKIYASLLKVYLDIPTYQTYLYNGQNFVSFNDYATATETSAGIVKLYKTTGQNEDGTMTQKAITNELGDKIEMAMDDSKETLILGYNIV